LRYTNKQSGSKDRAGHEDAGSRAVPLGFIAGFGEGPEQRFEEVAAKQKWVHRGDLILARVFIQG
jgi:hypothetical protein